MERRLSRGKPAETPTEKPSNSFMSRVRRELKETGVVLVCALIPNGAPILAFREYARQLESEVEAKELVIESKTPPISK